MKPLTKLILMVITALIVTSCRAQTRLSFDYKNVNVNDVIYSLSKQTQTTIIAPTIKQSITLSVKDVSVKEALHILDVQLGLMHYTLVQENGFMVVYPLGVPTYQYVPSEIGTAVISLKYADANKVAKIINDTITASVNQRNWNLLIQVSKQNNGQTIVLPAEVVPMITSDSYSNSLIIRGTIQQIDEITKLAYLLDLGRDNTSEVRIYHLTYASPGSMQLILSNSLSVLLGPGVRVSIDTYGYNTLIVTCPKEHFNHVGSLISMVDVPDLMVNNVQVLKTFNGNSITLSSLLQSVFRGR